MDYRPLGRTGLKVSSIGFGCWEFGGTYGYFDETEVIATVHRALDLGINCFDTAEIYGHGRSEALLAKALGPHRKDIILVTKFGIGYPDREGGRDSRRLRVMASIEGSLQRLETDYVDIYLVHWPDASTPFEETMRVLEEIVQSGKARFVGLSNFQLSQMQTCLEIRSVDVAQYGYHLFDRRMEEHIFPFCHEQNIGVMSYASLAHGLLAGNFTKETTFEAGDWRSRGGLFGLRLFAPENFATNLEVVEDLKAVAAQHGKTIAQLALRWVLTNPVVEVALVGVRQRQELEENMGAIGWSLSPEALLQIDSIFLEHAVDVAPTVWIE